MTDRDDDVSAWLRRAMPPMEDATPNTDLWDTLVSRDRHAPRARLRWFDLGLAAAIAGLFVLFPDWIWVLAYHL